MKSENFIIKPILIWCLAWLLAPYTMRVTTASTTMDNYYAHKAVTDSYGVIAPWYTGQNGQLDERIRIAAELYKRYPWVGTDKAVMAAPHVVYNTHWSISESGTITIPPTDPWMCGDLSQRVLSIIQGLTKYYAYSGDPLAFVYIPLTCDYILDYCLTDANHPWPKFPISTPIKGIGYKRTNVDVPNQLDLCAYMGVEMLRAYRLTGTQRYADAARHWGDVIAEKCNFSNPQLPPWSRYTNPQFIMWSDKLTGTTALISEFLDDLISIGYTGKDRMIVKARDAGRNYVINQMLPRWTDNEVWGRHYWDGEGAVMTGGVPWVCEYIMDHTDAFGNWKIDVRNILTLIFNRNCVNPDSQGEMYSGAWAIPESSSCCGTSLSYSQYTYAPAFIRYGQLANDEHMREIGRRMMLMATYDSKENGVCLDGLTGKVVAGGDWLNLAQPWPLCQAFKAIAWWPEIFGASRENHIVSSTSVVDYVVYEKGKITYSIFDAPEKTIDVLRLAFEPKSITANGTAMKNRTDTDASGYTVKKLDNGDCIVKIRHDGCESIVVEGDDPQTAVADEAMTFSGKWKIVDHDAMGGKMHVAIAEGATMTYLFKGNQVRLVGCVDQEGGLAEVYIDGVKQLTLIDCFSPKLLHEQVLYSKSGLANEKHELKIVASGKGNLVSKGDKIYIRGLQYSDASGETGFGEGGGSTSTQCMILGFTGRQDYVGSDGKKWQPGTEFVIRSGPGSDSVVKSWYTDRRSVYIGKTHDQELYRYGAHGKEFWANVTVGPGTYYVRLLFADTNIEQKMSVIINGKETANCLDVRQAAGGVFRAMEQVYPNIEPQNGAIEIRLKGCEDKEASVQAIEVGLWEKKNK